MSGEALPLGLAVSELRRSAVVRPLRFGGLLPDALQILFARHTAEAPLAATQEVEEGRSVNQFVPGHRDLSEENHLWVVHQRSAQHPTTGLAGPPAVVAPPP